MQDGDYFKHNAFINDLIKYPWPLAYEQTGPDDIPRILNTYVGYYLPSALIGKLFGLTSGYFFSFYGPVLAYCFQSYGSFTLLRDGQCSLLLFFCCLAALIISVGNSC